MSIVLAAASGACLAASPAQMEPGFDISGAGARPCSAWTEARDKMGDRESSALLDEAMMVTWVQGFLNGMNVSRIAAGGQPARLPDGDSIRTYVDAFCRRQPGTRVMQAALQLYLSNAAR
ncbi:hypothetical protein ACFQ2A_21715 [Variovorax dokdonensis]